MTLFLVRHGQTQTNAEGRTLSKADPRLNELGARQSEAVAHLLRRVDVSTLATSPALRSRETAEIIGARNHIRPSIAENLRERDLGVFDDMAIGELVTRRRELGHSFRDPTQDWEGVPGVETDAEVFRRVMEFLDPLCSDDANVCAVTHAGVIKSFFHQIFHVDASRLGVLKARNCSVAVFRLRASFWNFEALLNLDWRWTDETFGP